MANSKANNQEPKQQLKDAYEKAEKATVEGVENIKEKAKENFESCSEDMQKATKQATEKAEGVIKERPLLSVGAAFLAGWAVSKLLK